MSWCTACGEQCGCEDGYNSSGEVCRCGPFCSEECQEVWERRPRETPRFRFYFRDGCSVSGPVQGRGGFQVTLSRLHKAQELSGEGRDTGLFEPKSGHLACFPDFSHMGNGPAYEVDLSEVVRIEPAGFNLKGGR